MSDAITRCPKCATSFRITQAVLNSAKGSVRCGSCLYVFNAAANLVTVQPPANEHIKPKQNHLDNDEPAKSQKEQHPPVNDVDDDDFDDDVLISDDMDKRDTGDDLGDNIYLPEKGHVPETNLFERDRVKNSDDEPLLDDDSWALSLLDEKEAYDTQEALEKEEQRHSDIDEFYQQDQIDLSESGPSLDEADTNEEQHQIQPEFESKPAITDHASPFHIIEEHSEEAETETAFSFYDELEDSEEDTEHEDQSAYGYIHAIEPEPVEFSYRKSQPFWRSRGFFSGLSIVFMLLLVGQIAWLRFDELSTVKPYRTFYSYSCKLIGCKLPQLVDINKIRINQLIVRSHPTVSNSLIVDAIIVNNAKFEQPFPNLTLVFTDIQNNIMAHRIFSPKEYISGELKGRSQMPSLQPISLSFQIVDPGESAVNYLLTISQ